MNELSTTNGMTALASIERRINYHIHGAYANIVEVGRCLIEAKETGVVPHGQFEEWAGRVTGLQKRSYQRLMQVAREVSPDSAMAKLPITKITAILSLPEAQREEVAEKAVEENQSLRELQAIVDSMREELDETRKRANRTALERDNAIAVLDKAQKRRAEFEHECNELRRQMQNPATGISAEARKRIDQLKGQLKAEQRKVEILYTETQTLGTQKDALREMLTEAREAQATGISDEAQAEIDRLTAQLADAEKMAEYQARQREQAQQELLDLRTQAARGEASAQEDLTAEAVGMAARTFITSVGYLPHSDRLLTLREGDRAQIAGYAVTLQRWAEDVLKVINSARDAVILEGV